MKNSHFAEAFAADPLLIDPARVALVNASLNTLSDSDEMQTMMAPALASEDGYWDHPYEAGEPHPYRPYSVSNGTLSIPVQGVLLNNFSFQYGRYATGYSYVEKALTRGLADPGVDRIALVINSPGGEVAGCFECSDKIFEARGVKPIGAFAADHAYSAAYALASSASTLSVTRSGGTGSVGVVTTHVDFSEALANDGIKVTFIFAGKHKVEGNAYEALSDSAKARIQDRIDRIYSVFTGMVARNRGMDEKAVRATEALTFDAQDSVAKGFADRIGALAEEMVAFSEDVTDQEDESLMTTFTQEQMDAAVQAATAQAMTDGAAAEHARRTAIMGCDAAQTRPLAAAAFVDGGLASEQAIALLGKLPEEKATVAPAPAPVAVAAAGSTPFDKHMEATGNPEVGATAPGADKDADDDMKATASIVGSVRAYHGKPAAAA